MTQPPSGPRPQGPHYGYGHPHGHHAGGPGYPAFHQGPRPPRRPKGPLIAGSLGGVTLLVLSLVVVFTLTDGADRSTADGGYADSGVTTTTPPPPTSTSRGPATTTSPSREATSSSSSTPMGGTSPAARPQPRKVLALADHPMLQDPDAGLRNRVCNLPAWQSTPSAARAFFTAARQCLDAAWGPFLRAYNLPFTPPTLHFPSSASFDTQCGTINVGIATAAYYCEGDLYVPFDGLQTEQYGNSPGVYLALFAHEYGHHVQEMAGIMDAAWERIYAAGVDSPEGQEMSRRKELQAQCFSGMFLGAHVDQGGTITREMYNEAWYDQETRGDDTSGTNDHGNNANYAKWWRAGAYDNRIVDCNTFAAPASEVA